MIGKIESRTFNVKLNNAELDALAVKHADNESTIEQLTSRLKKIKSDNKDIALKLITREEDREVECEWKEHPDDSSGIILQRNDTFEVVEIKEK